ncbi:hypothetical protein FB451DRAFT_1551217 [Mycena latifolia]|nr:hypothetical protein FB451DRAFT_1551217 [Mycena latifolia]
MEESSQALDIQELVDQCIEFLSDSLPDLMACALVSRSWTSAAQTYIFREVSIRSSSSERLWARLQQILLISPHLIRHIHRLHLYSHGISTGAFITICQFPFTNLRSAAVFHGKPVPLRVGMAIQQLFSLPHLSRVNVTANFTDPSIFLRIWERCSSNLIHLEIHLIEPSNAAMQPVPSIRPPRIRLESLRSISAEYIKDWLMHDLCPLDVSHLKILSTARRHEDVFRWPIFAPALRTIEVLDFCPMPHANIIDLSILPKLALIRMSIGSSQGWHIALKILSTLPAVSRVRKIVINTSFFVTGYRCAQLDSKLLSLPVRPRPVLELESVPEGPSRDYLNKFFSRMISLNLLRYIAHDENWFENFGGV